MLASCPFCQITLPILELEWHANSHLDEDELAKDMELAQEIALASQSSRHTDEKINYGEPFDVLPKKTPRNSATSFNCCATDYKEVFDEEKIYDLVGLQAKSTCYKVEGGIMNLLRRCLELETKTCRSVISGYVDHYQSIVSEDSGWGCGWRNIQMLSSHLLMLGEEARDVLFGGSGFVPDIPSLQRWLEIAWKRGFDVTGSNSFNQKVYGSRKWIGTTECATLLRSFGLRARIVDFDSLSSSPSTSNALLEQELPGGKSARKQVYGPMDKYLHQSKCNDLEVQLSLDESSHQHYDLSNRSKHSSTEFDRDSSNKYKGEVKGHRALVDWVWNYFTNEFSSKCRSEQRVLVSKKTPLYFQHDGHSRTIVGIQKQQGFRQYQEKYSLLVLDPAQRTPDLERCLKSNSGWQQLIKRGVHTLRKPQYQLCYVDFGIANGEELEQLKTIDSIYVKL